MNKLQPFIATFITGITFAALSPSLAGAEGQKAVVDMCDRQAVRECALPRYENDREYCHAVAYRNCVIRQRLMRLTRP